MARGFVPDRSLTVTARLVCASPRQVVKDAGWHLSDRWSLPKQAQGFFEGGRLFVADVVQSL